MQKDNLLTNTMQSFNSKKHVVLNHLNDRRRQKTSHTFETRVF